MNPPRIILALAFIFLGLLVSAILLVYFFPTFFIKQTMDKKFTPEQKGHYEAWCSEQIQLPEDVLEVPPFRDETKAAAEAFSRRWAELELKANAFVSEAKKNGFDLGLPQTWINSDLGNIETELSEFDQLIAALISLVNQPDYEIDALSSSKKVSSFGDVPSTPNIVALHATFKLLGLKAVILLRHGKQEASLNSICAMLHSAKASPYSELIPQLEATALCGITIRYCLVLSESADLENLKKLMVVLNQKRSELQFLESELSLDVIDFPVSIADAREAKRNGIDATLRNGTAKQIVRDCYAAKRAYLEQVVLPAVAGDAAMTEKVTNILSGNRPMEDMLDGKIDKNITDVLFITVLNPNHTEARQRMLSALCEFDLLRLEVARKLYELEHGAALKQISDLVPDYLAKIPTDPFDKTNPPFRRSDVFYSIGPDRSDQRAEWRYDPTNGTSSAGDIFLIHAKSSAN